MNDTPPDVQERYDALFRRLSPQERLAMCGRMFSAARTLVRAGVIQQGARTEAEIRKQVFLRFYGNDFGEEERDKVLAHLLRTGPHAS